MPNEAKTTIRVEKIALERDRDKLVAVAEVSVGDMRVRGLKIWRSPKGSLRVFFPSHRFGPLWEEVVSLPDELRAEVQAEVISAYKATQIGAGKDCKNDEGRRKMLGELVSLQEAERTRALHSVVMGGLDDCGEAHARFNNPEVYVHKTAVPGWWRLLARVAAAIAQRNLGNLAASATTSRNPRWLAHDGLSEDQERGWL